MNTTDDREHQRRLLAANLRRLLAVEESLAQQPDNVSLELQRQDALAELNRIGGELGLGTLPDALATIAGAAGLGREASTSLQRQQRHLNAYRRAAELQHITAAPGIQVTLAMAIQRTDERLAEIEQQLAALSAALPPAPPDPTPTTPKEIQALPMPTRTLSSEQLNRLRALLGRCDEIDSNRTLRALFADPRLTPWRGGLPEADSLKSRVDLLISYLRDKRNTLGEHALVLLLWALAEKYDPSDERHDNLLALANELTYGVRVITPPNSPTNRQLERKIRDANGMLDIRAWMASLSAIERRVCRIAVAFGGQTDYGTGFLLAPDIAITNYHVVERAITGKAPSTSVSLLFDYHLLEDGVTPHVGTTYKLAAHEWLLDSSPYSPLDLQAHDGVATEPDQLDYALLRIAGAPGNELLESTGAAGAKTKRGWIPLPAAAYPFAPHTPLLIVQHPDGKELKLAIDTDAIIALNNNGTRVRYRTNTETGSSGSPCFDASWNLVALHHTGDLNYAELHQPEYNQGIPFAAIVSLLQARGKLALLNAAA